jgi:hypothetical protein
MSKQKQSARGTNPTPVATPEGADKDRAGQQTPRSLNGTSASTPVAAATPVAVQAAKPSPVNPGKNGKVSLETLLAQKEAAEAALAQAEKAYRGARSPKAKAAAGPAVNAAKEALSRLSSAVEGARQAALDDLAGKNAGEKPKSKRVALLTVEEIVKAAGGKKDEPGVVFLFPDYDAALRAGKALWKQHGMEVYVAEDGAVARGYVIKGQPDSGEEE